MRSGSQRRLRAAGPPGARNLLISRAVIACGGLVRRPVLYFLYLLYCVEAGIFLSLVPWSRVWVRSTLVHAPALRQLLLSGHLRGGVSALGILMLVVGMVDFVGFCRALRRQ